MDSQNPNFSHSPPHSPISEGGVPIDDLESLRGQLQAAQIQMVDPTPQFTHPGAQPTGSSTFAVTTSSASQSQGDLPGANNFYLASPTSKTDSDAMLSTKIVTVQVGERQFTAHISTLTHQSDYFRSMFSGRWAVACLDNGSYFIDADGDAFAHIMRFLRHQIYPVVYDRVKGHDYAMYMAILDLAELLGITKLIVWIKEEAFYSAVTLTYRAEYVPSPDFAPETIPSDQKSSVHSVLRTRKIYVCPRGIIVHRGAPERCGQACLKTRGDQPYQYEDEQVPELLKVYETVKFHSTKFINSHA